MRSLVEQLQENLKRWKDMEGEEISRTSPAASLPSNPSNNAQPHPVSGTK